MVWVPAASDAVVNPAEPEVMGTMATGTAESRKVTEPVRGDAGC